MTVKIRNSLKRTISGSFTIEAAVVVPMCMLIFLAVIYLGFYEYDQVTVNAVSEYAVYRQAEQNLGGVSGTEGLEAELSSLLLAVSQSSLSVTGDANQSKAASSANFQIPLLMVDQLTSGTLRTIRAEAEGNAFDGRKKLLLYKNICDGAGDILQAGQ